MKCSAYRNAMSGHCGRRAIYLATLRYGSGRRYSVNRCRACLLRALAGDLGGAIGRVVRVKYIGDLPPWNNYARSDQ